MQIQDRLLAGIQVVPWKRKSFQIIDTNYGICLTALTDLSSRSAKRKEN